MKTILALLIAIQSPGICPKGSIPDRLDEQLKREEGLYRNKDGQIVPYRDTRGRLLIGYGHNLDADAKRRQRRSPEDKPIPVCNDTTRTANGQPETNLPSIAEPSPTAETTYYQSTPEMEHNAQIFYFAVLKGDKQTAARHVHYPMRINSKPVTWIHNRKGFLRVYDRIFTRKFVACIDQGIPHDMFGNWQGWMIADGAIWFDQSGKVISLNPCPVTARRF